LNLVEDGLLDSVNSRLDERKGMRLFFWCSGSAESAVAKVYQGTPNAASSRSALLEGARSELQRSRRGERSNFGRNQAGRSLAHAGDALIASTRGYAYPSLRLFEGVLLMELSNGTMKAA